MYRILLLFAVFNLANHLCAQNLSWKLAKQSVVLKTPTAVKLLKIDSTGYVILFQGISKYSRSLNLIKTDKNFNVIDTILIDHGKLQKHFSQEVYNNRILLLYTDYQEDGSIRNYKADLCSFEGERVKTVTLGFQKKGERTKGKVYFGFSPDKSMFFFVNLKTTSISPITNICEIKIFDKNLNQIYFTNDLVKTRNEDIKPYAFNLGNDTVFRAVVPHYLTTKKYSFSHIYNTINCKNNTSTTFSFGEQNRYYNQIVFKVFTNNDLHLLGLYGTKKMANLSLFDLKVDSKSLLDTIIDKEFVTSDFKRLKINKIKAWVQIEGVKYLYSKYRIMDVLSLPSGENLIVFESLVDSEFPAIFFFLFSPLTVSGMATAIVSAAIPNFEVCSEPALLYSEKSNNGFVPIFSSQKTSNIYAYSALGKLIIKTGENFLFLFNESRFNAKVDEHKWRKRKKFKSKGVITQYSFDSKLNYSRTFVNKIENSENLLLNVEQCVQTSNNEWFVVLKPNAESKELFFGKLSF